MRKTIFVSVFSNFVVRNILNTGFLKLLTDANLSVVLLVPSREENYLRESFGSRNVLVEGLEIPGLTYGKSLAGFVSRALVNTNTVDIFLKLRLDFKKLSNILQYALSKAISFIFGGSKLAAAILRKCDYYFLPKNRFSSYFEKYNPVLVFCTDMTDRSEGESDIDLIRESKKRGSFVVGMVRSWDNLTGRGVIREIPDKIIVQNGIMKEECKKYNGIPDKDIKVVGIPHYDHYSKKSVVSKETFLREVGLSPNKKTVLFVTIADSFLKKQFNSGGIDYNRCILRLLKQLDPDKIQFLVRLPVIGVVDIDGLELTSNFVLDRPKALFGKGELDKSADEHLANSIYHSDIILPGPSTIAADALFFDKPIILMGFDDEKRVGKAESIRKFFKLEHLQPLVKSRGVKIAYSKDELFKYISDYISNPDLNMDEREKIAEEICWKRDGMSTKRLADTVIGFCG